MARPRLLLRRNTVGFLCSVGPGSISAQILAAPGPTTGRTTGRIGCRQILITEATNRWSTFDVGEYKRSGPRTGARSILPRGLVFTNSIRCCRTAGALNPAARGRVRVRCCEGLRMPVLCWWRGGHRSRRPQTSKGGNRGTFGEVLRQTLWGFRSWGCVAEVR